MSALLKFIIKYGLSLAPFAPLVLPFSFPPLPPQIPLSLSLSLSPPFKKQQNSSRFVLTARLSLLDLFVHTIFVKEESHDHEIV